MSDDFFMEIIIIIIKSWPIHGICKYIYLKLMSQPITIHDLQASQATH